MFPAGRGADDTGVYVQLNKNQQWPWGLARYTTLDANHPNLHKSSKLGPGLHDNSWPVGIESQNHLTRENLVLNLMGLEPITSTFYRASWRMLEGCPSFTPNSPPVPSKDHRRCRHPDRRLRGSWCQRKETIWLLAIVLYCSVVNIELYRYYKYRIV